MSAAPLTPAQWSLVADAAQLLEHGRAQDAAAEVAPLITAGCRHPDPLMIYAVASEQLGRFDDAIAACRAAVESSPERPDVCGTLGRMLQDQGRFVEAAAVIERAIALDQSAADNWHNLG